MNKTALIAAAAVVLGVIMAAVDSTSGPSLNLLAANSTILLLLTVILVGLFALGGAESAARDADRDIAPQRRAPQMEMVETLKGARDGYTTNRREIARILRRAVNARAGAGAGNRSPEAADAYLETILDAASYSEFIAGPEQMTTRVKATKGYITRVGDVVALVERSIGF